MGHFVDDDELEESTGNAIESTRQPTVTEEEPEEKQTSDNTEIIGAQFRQTNTVYLTYKAISMGRLKTDMAFGKPGIGALRDLILKDPEFDLKQTLDDNGIVEEDRKFFEGIINRNQFENALEYYYQDKRDEKILQNASFMQNLACGIIAGGADPIYWMPVGRALKFGSGLVRAAVEGALIGGVSYSIRAGTNNNFQWEDLGLETAAGGITSWFLTGAVKGVKYLPNTRIYQNTKEAFKEMLMPNISRWFEMENGKLVQVSEGSFGTIKQEAKRFIWEMVNNAPATQMYNSGHELLQKLSGRIFRNRVSNLRGDNEVASVTVEEAINLYEGESFALSDKIDKLRRAFVNKGGTVEEFNREVGKSIVNGDYALMNDTESEIGRASKLLTKFDEQILSRAEKYGALEEGFGKGQINSPRYVVDESMMKIPKEDFERAVKTGDIKLSNVTAIRHIVRKYNQKAIDEHIGEITEILDREILLNNPDFTSEQIAAVRDPIITKITGRDPRIKDAPSENAQYRAKILEERQVAIHDDLLINLGILDYDPVTNHTNALRQVVVDTELNRTAQELGFGNWDELKTSMEKEGLKKIGEVSREQGSKAANANSEAYNYDLALLKDTEALLKGTFTKKGSFANNRILKAISDLKGIQYASMSGQLLLSMIPDISTFALRTGASRLVKRFVFPKSTLEKADKETLSNFLNFLDRAIRKNRFRDMGYTPENTSRIAKYSERIADLENKITFVDRYNRIMKETAAEEIYSDLIAQCLKAKPDIKYLNKMGITEEFRKTIADTYKKYGSNYKNIFYVDPNYFDNEGLSRQIKTSVTSLVDQTILTPGAGDIPRYLRTKLGSFLFMFQSYVFLVYNNVMRPLFRGDIEKSYFAQALAVNLTLSGVREYAADYINGRETDPTSLRFWKDVINYSMLGNHITDAAFTAERIWNGRNHVSASSSTLSWIDNLINTIRDLTHGQFTKRVRNTLPVANTWYLRPLTNTFLENSNYRAQRSGF